jgi:cell division protein ZipA
MNELRIILLLVGVAVIAFIYIWETLKQKRHLRARIDGYHATSKSTPRIVPVADTSATEERDMAGFTLFLHQQETPAYAKPVTTLKSRLNAEVDLDLWNEPGPAADDLKPGKTTEQEIIVIYITADNQPHFNGTDILKAVEAADMKYGDMQIFHYYGPDRKHARCPLLSLANINEPGYFVLEDMNTFTTKGLALFLCLPAEMGGDIAFEFMLDAAHALARSLGGELRGTDRKPLDEDAINRLRAIANLY